MNLKYLIALNHFPKFGPVKLKKIKKYFPNYQIAWTANFNELKLAGLDEKNIQEFIYFRSQTNPDFIIEKLNKENIKTITIEDENYPQLLKEIHNPPQLLYYQGKIKKDEFNLAIVGTRKFTSYGRLVCENLTQELVNDQLTIVSGLAHGIDTIAHQTCLKNQGRTIAVLGTGLDYKSIYPAQNRHLAQEIVKNNGLVLSEFPLETQPMKYNFPQRNRIISGLSLGTLVIEAGKKSGALITSQFALEQDREVFAIPGSIYSSVSIGPNDLIKQGAKPITNAQEIIESLNLTNIESYTSNQKIIPTSKEEELIIDYLNREPKHINELVKLTNLEISTLSSALVIMEMKGLVKNLGQMEYIVR